MKKYAVLFILLPCLLLASGCSIMKPKEDTAAVQKVESGLSDVIDSALENLQNGEISDLISEAEASYSASSDENVQPSVDIPTETASSEVSEDADAGKEDDAEADSESAAVTEAKVKVPDVEGRPADEAEAILAALGLSAQIVEKESTSTEAGFVISQSPTADKSVKSGDTITLYVAKADEKEKEEKKETTPEPTEAPAPADSGKTYMYCAASDYLTLRDIASRSGRELARIPYNAQLEYLGMEGEFTFVSYNGQNGYVLTEFLSSSPDPAKNYSSGSKTTPAPAAPVYTLYCCASEYATLRSSASTSASAITTVPSRGAVSLISSVGEFYYVDYNGSKGYVLQKFFSTDPDAPLNYAER